MAQENKLPFMHRLMYSIKPNQMSLLSFQVVGKQKKNKTKKQKKLCPETLPESTELQYSSVFRTDTRV